MTRGRTSVLNKLEKGRGIDALFEQGSAPSPIHAVEEGEASPERELPLDSLMENPHQPRREMDDAALNDLMLSIRDTGVQEPIKVRPVEPPGTGYYIITGHRRARAARLAGLDTIPARILTDLDEVTEQIIMLDENVMRQDLSVVDKAAAIISITERIPSGEKQHFYDRYKITRSQMYKWRQLIELSEDIKEDIRTGQYSERHARAYWKLPTSAQEVIRAWMLQERPTGDTAKEVGQKVLAALYAALGDEYYEAPAQEVSAIAETTLRSLEQQDNSQPRQKKHRADVAGIQRLYNMQRSLSLMSWKELQSDGRHISPLLDDIALTGLRLRRQAGVNGLTPEEVEAARTTASQLAQEARAWLTELSEGKRPE